MSFWCTHMYYFYKIWNKAEILSLFKISDGYFSSGAKEGDV